MKSKLTLWGRSLRFAALLALLGLIACSSVQAAITDSNIPDELLQARLRISQCIYNGPDADVYVNGKQAEYNGQPVKIQSFDFSGYLYLPPGTVRLTVTPHNQPIDKVLIGPLDLTLQAGHRYTLAVLGQADETGHKALVIDETQEIQAKGVPPDRSIYTFINNLRGAQGLDHVIDGLVVSTDVPYGGYQTVVLPDTYPYIQNVLHVSGAPKQLVDQKYIAGHVVNPGGDSIECIGGDYPGMQKSNYGISRSEPNSDLNLIDFLKRYDSIPDVPDNPTYSFFLALIKSAGFSDTLTNGRPHLIFAPDDLAFARTFDTTTLNTILSDPEASRVILLRHVVEGYFPSDGLSGGSGYFNRTVTALSGDEFILFGNSLAINGVGVHMKTDIIVAGGTRLITISQVLGPVSQSSPNPCPGGRWMTRL